MRILKFLSPFFAVTLLSIVAAADFTKEIMSPLYVKGAITTGPKASPFILEGATDDGYETTITVTDPTADRTITIPNVTGTVVTSGNLELTSCTSLGVISSSGIVFEGSTADDYEITMTVADPGADYTVTIPAQTGTFLTTGGDVAFVTGLSGGADISVAAGAANTAGSTLDLVAGAGGAAGSGQVGKNGAALSLTGGAGSAKDGAGATDGDGGDVILLGGALGGTTGGSEVTGIVRVGSPTVGSAKTSNLLAVAGGLEIDGATRLDSTLSCGGDITFVTALGGGADISVASAAAATAGSTLDLVSGAGGTAATDSDGQAGGLVSVTGAAGSAKNGSGTNDGSGGDIVLLGGAKGGANGSAVDGIVRIGSPTVNATKATNVLAVGGALEVDGAIVLGTQTVTTALQNPGRAQVRICGEGTTVNNNTVYYGPSIVLVANTDGFTCDINAVGNVTEATADEPAFTDQAVHVVGMVCRNEADANADLSFTLRSAAGATTPSVTCTITDGKRDCVADVQTTTIIAAGATLAVAVASASDIGDGNGFICAIEVAY